MARGHSYLTKRQQMEAERATMEIDRSSFFPTWRELNDYILPMRGRFLLSDAQRGQRRNQKIIDSTATFAAGTLSAGMMSNMTNPSKPWFRLSTPDPALNESAAAKAWMQLVAQLMSTVFLKSNLYDALPQLYEDVAVFGTAAMAVLEDDEDVIRCYTYPIGSFWIGNDRKQRVRVWRREFQMTVRQLVDEFGGDGKAPDWTKFSERVKVAWENKKFGDWIDVVHVIRPNEEHDATKLHSKYKAFLSCYYERGTQSNATSIDDLSLREEGFDEFPILVARWKVSGEDVYGTSCPGMVSLGDSKQLQLMQRRGAQALEKMINPPLIGPTALQNRVVNALAGGITYTDERSEMQGLRALYNVAVDLPALEQKLAQLREQIRQSFYVNIILMLDSMDQALDSSQPRTAAEIAAREREKLTVLGPVLERHDTDIAGPLIDRTFAIMHRRGMIPPAPPEMEGVALKVEYLSVAALALKAAAVGGIERLTGYVGNLFTVTQNPDVLDKFDMDQAIDVYADAMGVDTSLIVSDDQVAQKRQQRAQAQQAQQRAEQVAQLAPAVKQLSETDTTGDNGLTRIAGAMAGQQPAMAS